MITHTIKFSYGTHRDNTSNSSISFIVKENNVLDAYMRVPEELNRIIAWVVRNNMSPLELDIIKVINYMKDVLNESFLDSFIETDGKVHFDDSVGFRKFFEAIMATSIKMNDYDKWLYKSTHPKFGLFLEISISSKIEKEDTDDEEDVE